MQKKKIIDIEAHAFLRALERGERFGLDYHDARKRIFDTVKLGGLAKRRHISKRFKTYYNYFNDNLSFYVICQEKEFENYIKYLIKTIIIEKGRE